MFCVKLDSGVGSRNDRVDGGFGDVDGRSVGELIYGRGVCLWVCVFWFGGWWRGVITAVLMGLALLSCKHALNCNIVSRSMDRKCSQLLPELWGLQPLSMAARLV